MALSTLSLIHISRDTLKIARELGIHLHFLDNLNDLLGMYTYRHKARHILLNSSMEYLIMQMVCGHEFGHDTFCLLYTSRCV